MKYLQNRVLKVFALVAAALILPLPGRHKLAIKLG